MCRSEDLISCTSTPSGPHSGVCLLRCEPSDKQNYSASSRYTWSALGLVTHHALRSRVTCWSPRMILPRQQLWRRWWWRGEMLGRKRRLPGIVEHQSRNYPSPINRYGSSRIWILLYVLATWIQIRYALAWCSWNC